MSSDVILYSFDEVGAPTITGNPGDYIGILDACLLNGFNAHAVLSLTVAAGIGTATVSAHGYRAGRKVLHAGADNVAVNGVKKIIAVPTSNTYTFDATGVADGTVTGAITTRRAPLGWSKVFGDATHGMYRRNDANACAAMLRIDDTAAGGATTLGVESATDIDTYTGSFGAGYTSRGVVATPQWHLVGDGVSFYFIRFTTSQVGAYAVTGFGDIVSFRSGDQFKAFNAIELSFNNQTGFMSGTNDAGGAFNTAYCVINRDFGGFASGPALQMAIRGAPPMGGAGGRPPFPSPVDNGLVIDEHVLAVELNGLFAPLPRGYFPGLAEPYATLAPGMMATVIGGLGQNDKEYFVVRFVGLGSYYLYGCALIDITGPWQ